MSQIALSEEQEKMLIDHHKKALREQKNLEWLEELYLIKMKLIEEQEAQLQKIKASLEELRKTVFDLGTYKTNAIQAINNELQSLLKIIVSQLGLSTNSKVYLSFKDGRPYLELQAIPSEN